MSSDLCLTSLESQPRQIDEVGCRPARPIAARCHTAIGGAPGHVLGYMALAPAMAENADGSDASGQTRSRHRFGLGSALTRAR
jgi:hypothetical protein